METSRHAIAIFSSGYSTPGIVNRRHPEGSKTGKFTNIEFQDDENATIATLLNFGCHPVVLGVDNHKISADYVYYVRDKIEKEKGGIAIYFNGGFGDINPTSINGSNVYDRNGGTFAMAESLGTNLATDMLNSVKKIDNSGIDIKIKTKIYTVTFKTEYADKLAEIKIIDLGIAQIATIPAEPVTAFKEKIEAILPGPYTIIIGMTDGDIGYVIPENEWGKCSYSMLSTGCYEETMAVENVAGILEQGYEGIVSEMYSATK